MSQNFSDPTPTSTGIFTILLLLDDEVKAAFRR